jgi:hypothetical protein
MAPVRPSRPATAMAVAGFSLLCLLSPRSAQADYYVRVVEPPPPPPRAYYYAAPPPPPQERSQRLVLGVDVEGAIPINVTNADNTTVKGGGGFKLRIGDQIRVGRSVRLTPELGYAYDHMFANDVLGSTYNWDVNRVMGGLRLSFGRWVVPVFYAHLAYGWRGTSDPNVQSVGGLGFDVGGALDLRVIPHFGFGVHIEYSTIDAQPVVPEWIALGLHAEVIF